MIFHKLLYKLGEKLKNKLIPQHLKFLKENDFSSIEKLEELQIIQLKKLLKTAKEKSPYYSKILKDYDLNSFTLKDLSNLPILTKEFLRNNLEEIYTTSEKSNLIESETSGSSGDALIFYRNAEWDAAHRAAQLRGYSWYEINPWDKNLYFWGFNPSLKKLLKVRILDFLVNRFRIFSFSDKVLNNSVKIVEKSDYIEGYSSTIFSLAQYMDKNNHSFSNIKMVKGTSEKIYDYYKPLIEKVFGVKFTSEYGAAETGIIAFECPEGNMHITMENVIVEIIESKIYVTNLYSYSLPIIRYELGDYVVINKDKKCSCGRNHFIIEEVTGRIGKKIYGNNSFYPTLTLYYIFKNIALNRDIKLAYFGKQYEKGILILEVIQDKIYDNKQIETYIQEESKKYFEDDMKVEVNFIEKLLSKNKKEKDFESFIDEK